MTAPGAAELEAPVARVSAGDAVARRPHRGRRVNRRDSAARRAYGLGMIPSLLAIPIALLPFASLLGALAWMAASSDRPGPRAA